MKVSRLTGPMALFIIALITVSCNSKRKEEASAQQRSGPRPPAQVAGFVVKPDVVAESVEVSGTIVAQESTNIHPEVSGRVVTLNVREGAQVGKGALIAKLYDGDLQAQKRKLQVQLKIAETTAARHQKLMEIGGISRQDYDLSQLQVSNLRADLDVINTEIRRTEVRAPFSGKLGLKEISTGAFVTPTTVITTIQKTTNLRIDFTVPEKYTSQIKKGHFVNFTVEGNDRAYTAVVMATESGISQATRSLTIRAQVRGDATGLVPGGFAKVRIDFEPDENALLIPTQAVIPQARGKKVYVYNNGVANFVDVTTGVRDSAQVQITSGLKAGDTVIITGLLSLKPEAKVALKQIVNQHKG